MKTKALKKANLVFIVALSLASASLSFAAQPAADKTTAKEVESKVGDSVEAIKNYSVDKRDEAIKNAKAAMDDLDARIDRMQSELDGKWDQMDQAARKDMAATLTALRKQRNEVAEWYGGMKHSSSNAWEDVKKGFLSSYQELRDSFDKARSKFQKDK